MICIQKTLKIECKSLEEEEEQLFLHSRGNKLDFEG